MLRQVSYDGRAQAGPIEDAITPDATATANTVFLKIFIVHSPFIGLIMRLKSCSFRVKNSGKQS